MIKQWLSERLEEEQSRMTMKLAQHNNQDRAVTLVEILAVVHNNSINSIDNWNQEGCYQKS